MKPLGHKYWIDKVLSIWNKIDIDEALKISYNQYGHLSSIDTNSYYDLYSTISYYCVALPVRYYLEIGVRSAGSMAVALGSRDIERSIGIDIWNGKYSGIKNEMETAQVQIDNFKKSWCTLIKGYSSVELMKIKNGKYPTIPEYFDLITVDGDHTYGGCKRDLLNCLTLLEDRSVLLVDDINHPLHKKDINKAIEDVEIYYGNAGFTLRKNYQGNGIAIFERL